MTAYHASRRRAPRDPDEIESDRFMNLKYRVAIKKEAGRVLGEYNKNAANPYRKLQEAMRNAASEAHLQAHDARFLKDILDMPNQYDYSLRFFDRFYRRELCRAGGGRREESSCSTCESTTAAEARHVRGRDPVEPGRRKSSASISNGGASEPYVSAGTTSRLSPTGADLPALDLWSQLCSRSRRLYSELVVDDQVRRARGGAEDHRDPYLFTW